MINNIESTLENLFESINTLSKKDKSIIGITTGFSELDNKISGLQEGQLITIAGRPSIGKTNFVCNLAEAALFLEKLPTLFFTFETNAQTLVMRMISSFGRVNFNHLRSAKLNSDDWSQVTASVLQFQDKKFSIIDNPSLSLNEIGSHIADFCKVNNNALVIIDDIQRIKPQKSLEGKMTRSDELTEISRYLKELAQKYQIPIVVVSQLNRNLENRPNKRPVISDLRDCGAIEDNADLIIFIYRDEVYNRESKDAGIAEIIIGKQRHGATGTVRLAFDAPHSRFCEFYAQYDDEE